MRRCVCNLSALIFVGVLCFLCSCRKETYSGEQEQSSAVLWDETSYDVSYLMTVSVVTSAPDTNKYFNLKLALENSEHPQKFLYLNCTNYIYGEKVDLTTDKYSSKIELNDGQKSYSVSGGNSRIKSSSYYVLTRKGNHVDLVVDLSYSGDNGYVHKLKVKYNGELPTENYLPSENWQSEPSAHYSFAYDEAQYNYRSFVNIYSDGNAYDGAAFELVNEKSRGSVAVRVNKSQFGEKVDLAKNGGCITIELSNEVEGSNKRVEESHRWDDDSILEGSYICSKKSNAGNGYEIVIDAKCKDADGTIHRIQAEYNIYR